MTEHHGPADLTAGPVALDIGPERGALIVHTDVQRLGDQIEIEAIDPPGRRTHVGVLRRPFAAGVAYAAVFGSLTPGMYALLDRGSVWREVNIVAGRVTEIDSTG